MSFIELARWDKMALHTLVYFSIKSTINQEFLSTSLSYFSWFFCHCCFRKTSLKLQGNQEKGNHIQEDPYEKTKRKKTNTRQLIYRMALNVCGSNFCHFWGTISARFAKTIPAKMSRAKMVLHWRNYTYKYY